MITLTPLEAGFLESLFLGIPDRLLIRELLRRERFGQVRANVVIRNEYKDDPKYLNYMKERLGIMVGRTLAKETERGYVVTEYIDDDTVTHSANAIFLRGPPKSFEP